MSHANHKVITHSNIFRRYLSPSRIGATAIALTLLTACGSDSSTPDNRAFESYRTSFNLSLSTGQSGSELFIAKDIFNSVDTIPAKYNYSNSVTGPYELTEEFRDGARKGFIYHDASGNDELINDDLETFTNADAITTTGNDNPLGLPQGTIVNFSQDATLFSSANGTVVGDESTSGSFTVLAAEQVSVPAGNFMANTFSYTLNITTTISSSVDTLSSSGTIWITDNNLVVKVTGGSDISFDNNSISGQISSLVTELLDYREKTSPAAMALQSSRIPKSLTAVNMAQIIVSQIKRHSP